MFQSKSNDNVTESIARDLAEIRKKFIQKINDFEINFKKFHEAECRNARRRGMRDGNKDIPLGDAAHLCAFEREIATAYAAHVAELAIDFGPYLERIKKDEIESLKQELKKIDEKSLSDEMNNLLEQKRLELERIEEQYHEDIAHLGEDPNLKNLRQSLEEIDDQIDDIEEKIGRRTGNEIMKIHPFGYILMLIFVGLAEIAATYNAFLQFEEPPITTIFWALGVGTVIAIGAHSVGHMLAISREKRSYILWAVLAAFIILFALYEVSKVRALSMADIPVKHISLEAFIAISLAVFVIGILLAFFTHDSNPKLARLLKKYDKTAKAIQAKERAMYNEKTELFEKLQGRESAIHASYQEKIKALENANQTLRLLYNDAVSLHDEILLGLQNMEKFIIAGFDHCVQEYRSANVEHRQQEEPAYWLQPVGLPGNFVNLHFIHDSENSKGLWHYNPN